MCNTPSPTANHTAPISLRTPRAQNSEYPTADAMTEMWSRYGIHMGSTYTVGYTCLDTCALQPLLSPRRLHRGTDSSGGKMSASRPGRDPRCGDVSSLVIICGSCSVHTATRRCHATPERAYRVHRMLGAWLILTVSSSLCAASACRTRHTPAGRRARACWGGALAACPARVQSPRAPRAQSGTSPGFPRH